jgi:hypothetical protein
MNCIAESHACSEGIKSEVTVKAFLINKCSKPQTLSPLPPTFRGVSIKTSSLDYYPCYRSPKWPPRVSFICSIMSMANLVLCSIFAARLAFSQRRTQSSCEKIYNNHSFIRQQNNWVTPFSFSRHSNICAVLRTAAESHV